LTGLHTKDLEKEIFLTGYLKRQVELVIINGINWDDARIRMPLPLVAGIYKPL